MTDTEKPTPRWEGVVKVQWPVDIAMRMLPVDPAEFCMVYDETRLRVTTPPANEAMQRFMNGRPKVYCRAVHHQTGELELLEHVEDQPW